MHCMTKGAVMKGALGRDVMSRDGVKDEGCVAKSCKDAMGAHANAERLGSEHTGLMAKGAKGISSYRCRP